ncbi:MAG TPA: globin domain-containing protein [Candidatus Dormibacteraeota bacterium]|jgi:hemoglobin-like flavoprotein
MRLQVDLLRTSFQMVIERQPNLTRIFYEVLFARHPEARQLFFRKTIEVQEQMLAETLSTAVDHLEDGPWLQSRLAELGSRHAEYGVTEEMYGWVAEALLAALARVAGDDWTPDVEAAWGDALTAIATLMLAAQTSPARRIESFG